MRPIPFQNCVRSRCVKSYLACLAGVISGATAFSAIAPLSIACGFSAPDQSTEVQMPLGPGIEAAIQVSIYEMKTEENPNAKSDCYAYVSMPLSAFPSTSNRYGTSEAASAIREKLDAWELGECSITVYYENDTGVDFAGHELCVQGEFGFEKGSFWSTESESFCWDPAQAEQWIAEAQAQEEAAAEAARADEAAETVWQEQLIEESTEETTLFLEAEATEETLASQ